MKNRKTICAATKIALLSICICLGLAVNAMASITVSFDADNLPGIGAFQFDVLDPTEVDALDDFSIMVPSGWLNMTAPGSKTFNMFSLDGSDLQSGIIGTFEEDVILGGWVLGDQDANQLVLGVDYKVDLVGTDYVVKAVPIPSTVVLLGCGLASIFGIRRKKLK